MMRRTAAVVSVVLLFVMSMPGRAAAQLNVLGKYPANNLELNVATFTNANGRAGLIGIAGSQRLSVVFTAAEWKIFVDMWQRATAMQSDTWRLVDAYAETGTKENTLLVVTAGPGVQFTMFYPKVTLSFILPSSEFASFAAKLREVTEYIAR
ncbi:MAG: hypothetical protein HY216_10645 [Candidatus Rokubacteria bacterium]|nr:hypothetical protein [Candidatus Rokubacteria bacterium]